MMEISIDPEVLLAQFNKLMQELLRGTMNRNCFRPWEIDLLLDIEGCDLRESNRRETLRRYQKAVQRNFDRGGTSLLKLSDYLNRSRKRARAQLSPAADRPLAEVVGAARGHSLRLSEASD